ncbi:formate dehydrogenase accessory sulfurtransferase FdhD [Helicobacter ganmani]|uniref:formate dehydrogenase accessory sulfurtransferase FdhD n=1 Tax=Helicobacter ganmani TaxID=60246 RepID=UPI003A84BA84
MESYYQALKIERISPSGFGGDSLGFVEDCVIAEERVGFYLNGKKLLSVMSIPKEQDCHIVGFLISEGVINDVSQIRRLEIAKDGKSVAIEAEIVEENLKNLFREKMCIRDSSTRVDYNSVWLPQNFSGMDQGKSRLENYPEGTKPYAIGESACMVASYGFDYNSACPETKCGLCRIEKA